MAELKKHLKLGFYLAPQYGWGDCREASYAPYDVGPLVNIAKKAESALIDGLFRADGFGFTPESAISFDPGSLDPLLALSSIAASTKNIGLIATISTTFNQPYITARQVLSLDHLSGGRAGWNAVTSFDGERAFSAEPIPDQAIRYKRANEFLEIVQGIWSTWQMDALVLDRMGKLFADPKKIDPFTFRGNFFDIEATSPLPPSSQGRPVQFQAGASEEGKKFAVRFAEAIYSASPDIEHGRALYKEIKSMVKTMGREAERFLIFPGASVVLGKTDDEARELSRSLIADLDFQRGRLGLEGYLGNVDLSSLSLDEPIPAHLLPPDTSILTRRRSRAELMKKLALTPGNTLRDVIVSYLLGNGHLFISKSYDGIADDFEEWFKTGAADGFILHLPAGADQFDMFIEHVIPRLQHKGIFRLAYEGSTLRENLGLTY